MAKEAADKLAAGDTGKTVTTVRKSALQIRQDSMANLIKQMTPAIASALPQHMTGERMARIVTTVMRRTRALAECEDMSFVGAVMTCAQLGLEPGPTGQAYLVPYGKECTFILGYRGMLELARRSGQVETIYARPVYELDEFHVEYGLNETLTHVPYMDGDGGKLKYVYAIVKYKDGGHNMTVMSMAAVERIRARSKTSHKGPWSTDYEAMALKTVVRQLAKWMPQSVEFQTALAVDGQSRTDTRLEALDDMAADPNVWDGDVVEEPVSAVPVSTPPAGMNPETGEVEAALWPEVVKPASSEE